LFVLGKPIAGGVPASVWGMTDAVARRLDAVRASMPSGHSGMGTTLSANALALAAMRATLEHVMTDAAYATMERLAGMLVAGLQATITAHRLPWHAVRVGARVEFICAPGPLLDGTQAEAAHAPELERAIHLALLNRGCLIAPFHNMMLVCPVTTERQIAQLQEAFAAVAGTLVA
jgi:glutamate-1-semialdehyde 2,1-aminomutase